MAEVKTKVSAVEVSMECPECDGVMEITNGMVFLSNPAQYPHKCTECGYTQHYSGVQYPYIRHVKE